jgi:hypothetical protein
MASDKGESFLMRARASLRQLHPDEVELIAGGSGEQCGTTLNSWPTHGPTIDGGPDAIEWVTLDPYTP